MASAFPSNESKQMKLTKTNLTLTAAIGAVVATTALAAAFPGQQYASQASVTIAQARSIANHVVPGTILAEELENEAGGTGLRYTFDIRGANGVWEVGIDAKTARVLENTADAAPAASAEGPEGSGD